MSDTEDKEEQSQWGRRDSKKKSKKTFASDNRRSVRWLHENTLKKANTIKENRERKHKEQDSWLEN